MDYTQRAQLVARMNVWVGRVWYGSCNMVRKSKVVVVVVVVFGQK
jgi:uncharacterized protein (DUF486 family)